MNSDWARNWWGAAWVAKIERLAEPGRFATGAQYARSGRVETIRFEGQTITALVQGTGEPAYSVRISFDPFSPEQWALLLAEVRDQRGFSSSLRAGDIPIGIETAFSKAKLRFMPERYVDLHLECACPDWLKPCWHIVAVWLRSARDFDRDPFILFQLRGLERDELLNLLEQRRAPGAEEEGVEEPQTDSALEEQTVPIHAEALPADPPAFWAAPTIPDAVPEPPGRRLLDDDILEKLGPAPFVKDWKALEKQFHQVYDSVYELASLILRQ